MTATTTPGEKRKGLNGNGIWRTVAVILLTAFIAHAGSYFLHGYNKVSKAEVQEIVTATMRAHNNVYAHYGAAAKLDALEQKVDRLQTTVDQNQAILRNGSR